MYMSNLGKSLPLHLGELVLSEIKRNRKRFTARILGEGNFEVAPISRRGISDDPRVNQHHLRVHASRQRTLQ